MLGNHRSVRLTRSVCRRAATFKRRNRQVEFDPRLTPTYLATTLNNFPPTTVSVSNACVDSPAYPDAVHAGLVRTYPPLAKLGAGFVWDDVLEYRVWCHPEPGSRDLDDGSDYYYPFATYAEAHAFSQRTEGAEPPIALIRQREYIAEPNPGEYVHVRQERIAEWAVEFLRRPRRTQNTIPDFLSPNAPPTGSTYCGV